MRVGLRVPTFRGQPTLRPWLAPTWRSVQGPLKLSGPSWLINPALGFRFEYSERVRAERGVAASNRVVVGRIGQGPQGQGATGYPLNKNDAQVVAV